MKKQAKKQEQKPSGKPPQSGTGKQQPQSGTGKQYGEGNYKATRDYNEGVKEHMQRHDVEKEARDAAPRSREEARDMERAEREARSRAKGNSKDVPEDPGRP